MTQTVVGTVVSNKMTKAVVVSVQTRKTHPIYSKQYNVTKKYNARDEKDQAKVGDKVLLKEIPPQSKTIRWAVAEVVEKAPEKK